MMYLQTYKSLLSISKEGLYRLGRIILDEEVDIKKKYILVNFFSKTYIFLQQFCKANENNQFILAEHKDIFLEHAYLDVGQIDLLCTIYEGNKTLCESISESFLEKFVTLIETEGRQANFLNFFMVNYFV